MVATILIGTRKGLFQFDENNSRWSITGANFLGVQVPTVLPDLERNRVFAALQHGHFGAKMQRSTDGGTTWEEVATPTYPAKPDDAPEIIDPMRKIAIPWSLEMIWCLETTIDGQLLCGTIPGGLFSSQDDGATWSLNESLWSLPNRSRWFGGGYDYPGIHSICPHPSDSRQVAVGVSCGGVWQSKDGADQWNSRAQGMRANYVPPELTFDQDIQDPHRMVQCPSAPECFWAQHHNGIFKSNDGLATWEEVTCDHPSSFGFAVCVHPQDPETAWFAPAISDELRYPTAGQFVVTRTRDGGKSFSILSHGLPQQHAYHLIYRHGMDVDKNNALLAMGSTTGALWVSEDLGDTWQTIATDLPPIYCVRFM